ncbi:MAG: transcription antitermination factor NusB [Planctomycetota bacterium]
MRKRTRAREIALQGLYQWQLLGEKACADAGIFCREKSWKDTVLEYELGLADDQWRLRNVKRYSDGGEFLRDAKPDAAVAEYLLILMNGVRAQTEAIDQKLKGTTEHWDLARMALVDLTILRIGAYELMFQEDIPPKVALNEAIDLAKRFGGAESGSFVNGILDNIRETGRTGPLTERED